MLGDHSHGQKGNHAQVWHTQVLSYPPMPACHTHEQICASPPFPVVCQATGHRFFVKSENSQVPCSSQHLCTYPTSLPQTGIRAFTPCTMGEDPSAWPAGSAAWTGHCQVTGAGGGLVQEAGPLEKASPTPTALCFWPCIWAELTEAIPVSAQGRPLFLTPQS